jgi:hypothetical protein
MRRVNAARATVRILDFIVLSRGEAERVRRNRSNRRKGKG